MEEINTIMSQMIYFFNVSLTVRLEKFSFFNLLSSGSDSEGNFQDEQTKTSSLKNNKIGAKKKYQYWDTLSNWVNWDTQKKVEKLKRPMWIQQKNLLNPIYEKSMHF